VTTSGTRHVELYVRSLAPRQARQQQDAVIDRLVDLEREGRIDEFTLLVWGRQVPASPARTRTDAGLFALNRIAVFTEWADGNGYSVDEQFQRRTVDSTITDETYQVVTVPVMTLAAYRDEDLQFVAPVSGPDGDVTVQDRLAELATDATPTVDSLDQAYASPPRGLTLVDPAEAGPDSH
jgi:hypothetical protein